MGEIFIPRTKIFKPYDLGGGEQRIVIDPTLTVQPAAKDAYLKQDNPTNNYGAITSLQVQDYVDTTWRTLLEFDISELPPGATLNSASLNLNYYSYTTTDPVGKTIWAYKLTRPDWVEAQATWNIYKTGSDWTSAGGDYVTSDPAGGSTTFPAEYDWMSWNVLPIVQDAYDGSIAAEFLVKFETEGLASGDGIAKWYSSNYPTDTSLCPKLVIDYAVAAVGRSQGHIFG